MSYSLDGGENFIPLPAPGYFNAVVSGGCIPFPDPCPTIIPEDMDEQDIEEFGISSVSYFHQQRWIISFTQDRTVTFANGVIFRVHLVDELGQESDEMDIEYTSMIFLPGDPPEIIDINPSGGAVALDIGEDFLFSVDAIDPDGDLYSLVLEILLDDEASGEGTTFTVYRDSLNPYGDEQASFNAYGLNVFYELFMDFDPNCFCFTDIPRWTFTFGQNPTGTFANAEEVHFVLTAVDSMENESEEEVVTYMISQPRVPSITSVTPPSGNIELDADESFVFIVTASDADGDLDQLEIALQIGNSNWDYYYVCVSDPYCSNEQPFIDAGITVEHISYTPINDSTQHEWTLIFDENTTNTLIDEEVNFIVKAIDVDENESDEETRTYTFSLHQENSEEPQTQNRSSTTAGGIRYCTDTITTFCANPISPSHNPLIEELYRQLLALLQQLLALMVAEQQ